METTPVETPRGKDGQWRTGPEIVPLGDRALLVRFGKNLDDVANRAALILAARLRDEPIAGVVEVVPSLVSVLVRYDPGQITPMRLSGELSLRLNGPGPMGQARTHRIGVQFDGPDIAEVASALGLQVDAFIEAHNCSDLRVLTTGFAPGFVYCGFHDGSLVVPRRAEVRRQVPAGSVLFAAGQTAITATDIPTGWHVIGRTDFRNFDPALDPPTRLRAGDHIAFEALR